MDMLPVDMDAAERWQLGTDELLVLDDVLALAQRHGVELLGPVPRQT